MSKQEIIDQTVQLLEQLPEEKAAEILDFAAFLMQRSKTELYRSASEADEELRADIASVVAHSKSYDFLNDEPDLYSDNDLVERYK